ncbi:MAG TPA: APC family permease [Vicinamibacterales bacterium]|nr:APC family permease [Vicinamibacterales bacterium]
MTDTRVAPTLKRALGKWDLTGVGINQVIGSGVFLLPAALAAQVGGWSWIAVALVALLALFIALNFAEAGSRFEGTGGAYLYTRAAFGRFVSFEVGWMLWVARATSWASVVNGLADALGYYWPSATSGALRVAIISTVVLTIMFINIRGIRQSANVVNVLTFAKLTPLVIFILVGLPFVQPAALAPGGTLGWEQVSASALLLIFAFGGYETIPVPAGEARDPRRAVPFAMIATVLVVAAVMILVQIVALGTLPGLAGSRTPLADAAALFMGGSGALLMTVGATISMTGNNMGQALSGSRNLYALAEQGDLPPIFGRVHPRFQTPDFAIAFTSLVALGLAFSGSFATMAAASAVARLLVYAGTCASVLRLRREGRASFTIPGGPVVPVVALVISVAILYGASAIQLQVGLAAVAFGAALYLVARRQN